MQIENIERLMELLKTRRELKTVAESVQVNRIEVSVYVYNMGNFTAELPLEFAGAIKDLCIEKLTEVEEEIKRL